MTCSFRVFSYVPWAINCVTGEAPMLRSLDLKDCFDLCGRAGWQRCEAQCAAGVPAITLFAEELMHEV